MAVQVPAGGSGSIKGGLRRLDVALDAMLRGMADGKTHDLHGLLVTGFAVVVCVIAIVLKQMGIADTTGFVFGVAFGALYLSPDLDMLNTRPARRWGPLKYFWLPYAWLHKHRGVSHSWLIGPAVRIIYLGAPVALIWWCWDFVGAGEWVGCLADGVYLGNWTHLAGDRHWPWS